MKIFYLLPILVLVLSISLILPSYAEVLKQTMEGAVDIEITFPDSVLAGRSFTTSFFVKNNGWEDKQDISFTISNEDSSIIVHTEKVVIDKLAAGGTFGQAVDFTVADNAIEGTHFLNIVYSQVLVANNEKSQPPTQTNIAVPILIKDQPNLVIHTETPESVFANAEFPFKVEILSQDIPLRDLKVQIIPPQDIEFRGQTSHMFSSIKPNDAVIISSQIITAQKQVHTQHEIPFQIVVTYTDDLGNEKTDTRNLSLLLRPRSFYEITTDGGIWIGSFFLAPYISIGTVIGIPAGAILTLLIRRSQKKKPKKKKIK